MTTHTDPRITVRDLCATLCKSEDLDFAFTETLAHLADDAPLRVFWDYCTNVDCLILRTESRAYLMITEAMDTSEGVDVGLYRDYYEQPVAFWSDLPSHEAVSLIRDHCRF